MFCVAICDDEKAICSEIKETLRPYTSRGEVEIKIFYSGETLYESLLAGAHFDLIFLDIELNLLNGVAVGKKIREELCNETVHIVFISGQAGYAMDLFEIRPLHFLTKPFSAKQIFDVVEKAMRLSTVYNDLFEFQIEGSHYKERYGNIVYFESRARKITMHTASEDYDFYGKLNRIERETNNYFLRVHQSFLVNPLYIEHYEYNKVILIDRHSLPISESYRKSVRAALLKDWGKI